jgi:hypothetical protein
MQIHLLSLGSGILSIIALFLSGLVGIGTSFAGIMLALAASKRKESGYAVGMFVGATVMIFLNLQTFGLFSTATKSEIEKVYNSIRSTNQAYEMLTDEKSKDNSPEIAKVIENALIGAKQVDVDLINSVVSGFTDSFQGEYIKGFSILAEGYSEADDSKKIVGAMLVDNWGKWNQVNKERLENARKKTPSLVGFVFGLQGY